ncbi:MAG: methyltransferase [Promethearchaeota archaeon]
MKIKGLDKLKEKLPDFQGKDLIKVLVVAILSLCSSLIIMVFFDVFPRFLPDSNILNYFSTLFPVFGVCISLTIGFSLISQVWKKRILFLSKYNEQAYQKGFIYMIVGLPFLFAIIGHMFLPIILIFPHPELSFSTWVFSRPLTELLLTDQLSFQIFSIARLIIFIIFLIIGILALLRAVLTFGLDYMALVYLYYPEESKLQNHAIYSILRHPTYHSLLMIGLSAVFLRFSLYSFIFFIIFLFGITLHIKLVEEKELIQRFRDDYVKYKQDVPAFFVRLKDIGKYFRFLIGID